MSDVKKIFHKVSYLQYPLMLVALFFCFQPYFNGLESLKKNPDLLLKGFNSGLIFMGLGINFSSLQDTTKTQNKLSKKIWKNPKYGKIIIAVILLYIIIFLISGLVGYYFTSNNLLKELSTGLIVLGLGMFGFLKTAIEMFENHRNDKN